MAITAEIKKTAADTGYAVVGITDVAVEKGREAAGRVEETYGELSARGKQLVERVRKQRATQDLVAQGRIAVSRTKAAITTTRRGAQDTAVAASATADAARRGASEAADDVATTTRRRSAGARSAAEGTANIARQRAARSKSATKAAASSAAKTAETAVKAAEDAGAKVGD